MNWSGYVIGFNTDEELDKIVEICKAHNDYDPAEHSDDEDEQIGFDTHGGTLQNFATAVFKEGKGYKPKGIYKQISTCTRVLICGIMKDGLELRISLRKTVCNLMLWIVVCQVVLQDMKT